MPAAKAKRAVLYLRVSTDGQTTENQRIALEEAAKARGWIITRTYEDHGISGAKGRDKRPAFDAMLKDGVRGRYDVVMAWSVDRLGRSLSDLVAMLSDLQGAGRDLYLHQQGQDTTTPTGKMLFQLLGVFAEFERSLIVARVNAGIRNAKARGVKFGRPRVSSHVEDAIRERLRGGMGMLSVAKAVGVGTATVQRVKAEMTADAA